MTQPVAGRELDALMAEKVMEWQEYRFGKAMCWRKSAQGAPFSLPCFSANMGSARRVVEKMQLNGWAFGTDFEPDADKDVRWRAWFSKYRAVSFPVMATAGTSAAAVCEAALKAITLSPSDPSK